MYACDHPQRHSASSLPTSQNPHIHAEACEPDSSSIPLHPSSSWLSCISLVLQRHIQGGAYSKNLIHLPTRQKISRHASTPDKQTATAEDAAATTPTTITTPISFHITRGTPDSCSRDLDYVPIPKSSFVVARSGNGSRLSSFLLRPPPLGRSGAKILQRQKPKRHGDPNAFSGSAKDRNRKVKIRSYKIIPWEKEKIEPPPLY